MRNSKVKKIRRMAKRIGNVDVAYNDYVNPVYDMYDNKFKVGIPRTLTGTCTRFIYKTMKKGY